MRRSDPTKESGVTISAPAGEDWWTHRATGELLARLDAVGAERDALREKVQEEIPRLVAACNTLLAERDALQKVAEAARATYEAARAGDKPYQLKALGRVLTALERPE